MAATESRAEPEPEPEQSQSQSRARARAKAEPKQSQSQSRARAKAEPEPKQSQNHSQSQGCDGKRSKGQASAAGSVIGPHLDQALESPANGSLGTSRDKGRRKWPRGTSGKGSPGEDTSKQRNEATSWDSGALGQGFTHGLWARVPSPDAVSANGRPDLQTPVLQLMPIALDHDAAMLRQAPSPQVPKSPSPLCLYALKSEMDCEPYVLSACSSKQSDRNYLTAQRGKEDCANPDALTHLSESPRHIRPSQDSASDKLQHPSIQTCVERGVRLFTICYLALMRLISICMTSERSNGDMLPRETSRSSSSRPLQYLQVTLTCLMFPSRRSPHYIHPDVPGNCNKAGRDCGRTRLIPSQRLGNIAIITIVGSTPPFLENDSTNSMSSTTNEAVSIDLRDLGSLVDFRFLTQGPNTSPAKWTA
ncbi:hypothetical protein E6O75_ATG06375 [Venturia nashicola]|uniref:Uncharacterized protein n=1 Tax=Venturia nashicola TaxID=86259 RepID=A0A4Z1NTP1_9PEZI|nr:hypothetical protein E6O75_ATG06375 [Venturia nashicola]